VGDLTHLLAADLERWRQLRERRSTAAAQMSIEERSDAAHCWTRQYREAFAAIGGDAVIGIMRGYLEDEDFGFDAGWVLKEVWDRQQNAPAPSPLKAWPDFATVAARRLERRAEAAPAAAAPPAAMIFAAIGRMAAPGSSEKRQRVAIALGRVGLSMPHGNQGAAIDALLALPELTYRPNLLNSRPQRIGFYSKLEIHACIQWLTDFKNTRQDFNHTRSGFHYF
jgi:hypothetical protein